MSQSVGNVFGGIMSLIRANYHLMSRDKRRRYLRKAPSLWCNLSVLINKYMHTRCYSNKRSMAAKLQTHVLVTGFDTEYIQNRAYMAYLRLKHTRGRTCL